MPKEVAEKLLADVDRLSTLPVNAGDSAVLKHIWTPFYPCHGIKQPKTTIIWSVPKGFGQ